MVGSGIKPVLPTLFSNIATQTDLSFRQICCNGGGNEVLPGNASESKSSSKIESSSSLDDVLQRRLNPKTKEDFGKLFEEVEQWRDCKLKEIENLSDLSPKTKTEKKATVLTNETKLLRKITKLKRQVVKERSERKLKDHLDALASDKVWEMSNGEKIFVETSAGKYASRLVDMYQRLSCYDGQEGETIIGNMSMTEAWNMTYTLS